MKLYDSLGLVIVILSVYFTNDIVYLPEFFSSCNYWTLIPALVVPMISVFAAFSTVKCLETQKVKNYLKTEKIDLCDFGLTDLIELAFGRITGKIISFVVFVDFFLDLTNGLHQSGVNFNTVTGQKLGDWASTFLAGLFAVPLLCVPLTRLEAIGLVGWAFLMVIFLIWISIGADLKGRGVEKDVQMENSEFVGNFVKTFGFMIFMMETSAAMPSVYAVFQEKCKGKVSMKIFYLSLIGSAILTCSVYVTVGIFGLEWICGNSCPEIMFSLDTQKAPFDSHKTKFKIMTILHLFLTVTELPLLLEVVYLPVQPLIKLLTGQKDKEIRGLKRVLYKIVLLSAMCLVANLMSERVEEVIGYSGCVITLGPSILMPIVARYKLRDKKTEKAEKAVATIEDVTTTLDSI